MIAIPSAPAGNDIAQSVFNNTGAVIIPGIATQANIHDPILTSHPSHESHFFMYLSHNMMPPIIAAIHEKNPMIDEPDRNISAPS